jgi:hypothetical protein
VLEVEITAEAQVAEAAAAGTHDAEAEVAVNHCINADIRCHEDLTATGISFTDLQPCASRLSCCC